MSFYAYILLCADSSYYAGHTDNLEKRMMEHHNGVGCTYTKKRLPVKLVWSQDFTSRDEAKQAEAQIKGWSRAKKEALIDGNYGLLCLLSSRKEESRALRDALLRKAPQGRGKLAHSK
ncbi:MAG: GIY-YIG nuclease family protein [Myxococcales bacterium]|nr:MAG: GIY-YIG nuclease family protein [Myxococcales bacterium]